MWPKTEPKMPVRPAGDIELEGRVKHPFVAVRRHFPNRQLVTFFEQLATEFDIARDRSALVNRRRRPADNFLNGGSHQLRIPSQLPQLLRMLYQGTKPRTEGVARSLRACRIQ